VLYLRVSSYKQRRCGNLDHQRDAVRRRIRQLSRIYHIKIEIIDEFWEDVSAWRLWKSERPELVKAGQLASETGAILVALNTTRFVRNNHHARGKLPTVDDFERLKELVGNVPMATLRYPDYHEDRGADTMRGQKSRGAKPRRPKIKRPGDKNRRRMSFKLSVIRLFKQGLGNREIGRQLNLPEKTVRDWRKRYRKYWDASFLKKQRQNNDQLSP
jgi:hypothetical protein